MKPSDPLLMTRPPSPADDLMHGWILFVSWYLMGLRQDSRAHGTVGGARSIHNQAKTAYEDFKNQSSSLKHMVTSTTKQG